MRRRWRAMLAPAGLAACLAATACGGAPAASANGVASAGGAKKAADTKASDPQQAGLDFARCMREHGVDVPDPETGDGGMVRIGPGPVGGASASGLSAGPPAGFEEADKACRHFLQDLVGDGPGKMDPQEQDRALKFAACMRDHGVDMPDPDFSGGGVRITIGGPGGAGVDPDSETFKDAQKACGSFFGPAGGAGATAGGGAGPGIVTRGKS